jgi:hypothetical protein
LHSHEARCDLLEKNQHTTDNEILSETSCIGSYCTGEKVEDDDDDDINLLKLEVEITTGRIAKIFQSAEKGKQGAVPKERKGGSETGIISRPRKNKNDQKQIETIGNDRHVNIMCGL